MVPHAAACSALHSHESCRHTGALAVCVCRRTLATSFAKERVSNPFLEMEKSPIPKTKRQKEVSLLCVSPPLAGWSGFSWTAPTLAPTRLCPLANSGPPDGLAGQVSALNKAWASLDPLLPNFWKEVSKRVPGAPDDPLPPSCCPCFSSHHPRATSHFITRRLGGETSSCIGGGEGGVSEASDG